MQSIPYNNKYFRILAAFGATMVILFHDRPFDLYEALRKPMFYVAFVASFWAALLILYIVHLITIRLDKTCPWKDNFLERFVYQICLGTAVPAVIDFLLFFFYYLIRGENILNNYNFLAGDLWYVILMLLSLNLYYGLFAGIFFWRMKMKGRRETSLKQEPEEIVPDESQLTEQPKFEETDVLKIKYKKIEVHLFPKDIYCLHRSGNNVRVLTADKNNYACSESLNSLEARFRGKGLVRINREVIVNQEIVNGYQPGTARDTLQLVIKHKYSYVLHILTNDKLIVKRDHLQTIKAAFPLLSRNSKKTYDD